MKRIFTLALLAIGLFVATPSDAQVKFGLKGGLNVTDIHISNLSDNFDKTNRAGWFIGPTIKIGVPITGLSFDVSALYNYKSNKISQNYVESTDDQPSAYNGSVTEDKKVKQQSIDVPINVRYGVGLGDAANIFLFAGPQWSFNIGDKDFKWTNGSSYSLRSTNFSVNVGVGATVIKHLQLTVNYNIACGKTADLTVYEGIRNATKSKSRNNSWQIGLAYYF